MSGYAAASGVSPRTLTRLFGEATGLTPLRYQQTLRVERAEHLIGQGTTVVAYAQFGPLTAYPRAQRVRDLYSQLPDARSASRTPACSAACETETG